MSQLLQDYVKRFMLLYQTVFTASNNKQKQEQPFYRIVKMPDDFDKCIHFQIIGKGIHLKMLPEIIMRDNLLLFFSKADIILITHLGTKNELISQNDSLTKNKLFKILKQIIDKGRTYFVVEKSTGEISQYHAEDVYDDESLMNNFCSADAVKIGYTAAEEHYKKIESLKDKS